MKEGVGVLAAKLHMLRRYVNEVKQARYLSALAIGVAATASGLFDVALPPIVAALLEKLVYQATFPEVLGLLYGLWACIICGCLLIPLRFMLRRLLQSRGHDGLVRWIVTIICKAPMIGQHLTSSAKKQFIDTWERFTIVLIDQFVPFVVGVGGLIVILFCKAPLVAGIAVLLLVITWLIARAAGGIMGATWQEYKDYEHHEHSIMDDLVASAKMLWLTKILVKVQEAAGIDRANAMNAYIGSMVRYQAIMSVLSNGFKLLSITGGIVLGTVFHADFGLSGLLVIYGLSLGDRMSAVFGMTDMLNSSAVEVAQLVTQLEQAVPLGRPVPATSPIIIFKNVIVRYPKKLVPLPPDMRFYGGIYWIRGPKGSGKTSGGEAVCGLRDYLGSLTIDGYEVRDHDVRSIVFNGQQSFEPYDRPAWLLFPNAKHNQQLVKQVLWCVGYPDACLEDDISERSGGQILSLCLAAVLHAALSRPPGSPGIIFLDEPTNHLDQSSIDCLLHGLDWLRKHDPRLIIWINSHNSDIKRLKPYIVELGATA
jgi:ABC-type multidrug transport system fused ATPase/permease subunit